MTAGTLDPNGVWQYGESDTRDTFSGLLNIGQQSVSDAIGADRARLAALESGNALGAVQSNVFTPATGWAIAAQQARKKGGLAFFRIRFTRSGAAITVPAGGDIPNTVVANVAAGWDPAVGMVYPCTTAEAGPVATGVVTNGTPSTVSLGAVSHGVTIPTGGELTLSGVYPLA